ncbi:TPA: hypothetical protein NG605_001433 [Vibrio parahaemolyticus]|uniref:hypothetical protein n=1 Tax=Vibrio chemaguriensis TaxID=2527672 RepID=UPI001CDBD3B9|nr:hypothetical protein [Vibrio chemaguriensis]MDF4278267.1 hypothetical protein [Vibrio parahaemolyticus]MCA2415565.1 hypothetical protein [Vibrio chemaguriensis]MCA2426652.1 hypothetical protein [Vibrio chemaguriensis]MDG2548091.1 hypothetical protein [Vibrio parahaemolyticus]MDG2558197.1 hypothetical protein [Vibrio parahaemolyticus]
MFLTLSIITSVVTNLPLQQVFGTLGSSVVFIISSAVFVILFGLKRDVVFESKLVRYTWYYYLFSFFTSLMILSYQGLVHGNIYSPYGGVLLTKHFAASTYNLVYCFYITSMCCLISFVSQKKQYYIYAFVYFFLVIVGILQYIKLYDFNVFHNNIVEYSRIRLLSPEPSMASLTFNVLGLVVLSLSKSRITILLVIISLLFINIIIASKVALLLLFVSFSLVAVFSTENFRVKAFAFSFIIVLSPFIFIFLSDVALPSLTRDIESFTSFATRGVTTIWAFLSLFYYPFGEGYGTFQIFAPEMVELSSSVFKFISPYYLNYNELNNMISNGENLSVKSGILNQIVYSGLSAAIFYFIIFKLSFSSIEVMDERYNKYVFKSLMIYVLISILFFVNTEVMYISMLPLIIACNKR